MENKENLVLAIDYGTQSVRAMLFNKKGEILCKNKVEFKPYFSLQPGWAEQYGNVYWEKFCEATKGLKADNEELFKKITAVSVTTIRDSCACIDKDGNLLRPIILWLDQRQADCSNQLPKSKIMMYKLVKMYEAVKVQMKASHSNWIKENEPEIWVKTYKFMMFSGYISYLLTGKMIDSVANQIGHIPFNYKKRCWMIPSDLNYYMWEIDKEKLCDLVEPGEIIGYITDKASLESGIPLGLPLYASGSDKGCETIGTGCKDEETASLSFGTTATVQITTDKYFEPITFMPSYPAVLKGHFNPEIQVYRGYWMISWFKKEFAAREELIAKEMGISAEEILDKTLSEVPAGCQGLILQPYWSPTLKAPEGKGAIIGFSDVHTRAHLYRAIIEGIGYGLLDGLKNIEKKSGKKVKRLTVSGGGSKSDIICQLTANIFGIPVWRVQTYETSGLGAAMTAFVGMGVYKDIDEAMKEMVHLSTEFKPDKEQNNIYNELFVNVYRKMYKQLKPMYCEIQKIINKKDNCKDN